MRLDQAAFILEIAADAGHDEIKRAFKDMTREITGMNASDCPWTMEQLKAAKNLLLENSSEEISTQTPQITCPVCQGRRIVPVGLNQRSCPACGGTGVKQ